MAACERALGEGVFAQGIRPPTVPTGTSRLRLAVMASHTKSELRNAATVLARAVRTAAPAPAPARTTAPRVYDGIAEAA
jgi:glycine C-acetyltransferase/8-amino-7-oxononanoate synthase